MADEYISLTEAARRIGLSDPAFRRRVRRGEIATYHDPRDWRRRLVKLADLDAYVAARPMVRTAMKEGAMA